MAVMPRQRAASARPGTRAVSIISDPGELHRAGTMLSSNATPPTGPAGAATATPPGATLQKRPPLVRRPSSGGWFSLRQRPSSAAAQPGLRRDSAGSASPALRPASAAAVVTPPADVPLGSATTLPSLRKRASVATLAALSDDSGGAPPRRRPPAPPSSPPSAETAAAASPAAAVTITAPQPAGSPRAGHASALSPTGGSLLTPTRTASPRRLGPPVAREEQIALRSQVALSPPRSLPASRGADWALSAGTEIGTLPRESTGLGGPGSSGLFARRLRRGVLRTQVGLSCIEAAGSTGSPALPYPVPDGAAAAAEWCGIDALMDRRILETPGAAELSLSEEDVRRLYQARCADGSTTVSWDRYGRFAEMVLRKCPGGLLFDLSDAGLRERSAGVVASILRDNESFTLLDLSGNCIRNAGAGAVARLLRGNDNLVHLALRSCGIGPGGAAALAGALRSANRTLTSLDLSGSAGGSRNLIGPQGAAAIATALLENGVLAALNLACCGLGQRGARLLAPGLGCCSLQEVDLSRNAIGPDGGVAVATGLAPCSALRALRLRGNAMRDKGVAAVAGAAREPLETLDLGENDFTAVGLRAVAPLASQLPTLRDLNLDSNAITQEISDVDGYMVPVQRWGGLQQLAAALKDAPALCALSMRHCGLDAGGSKVLVDCLAAPELTSLSLGGNPLGAAGASALFNAIANGDLALRRLDVGNIMLESGGPAGVTALVELLRKDTGLQRLQLQHRGVLPAPDRIAGALLRNTSLVALDIATKEIGAMLQRNRQRWRQGRRGRLAAQIEGARAVESELRDKRMLMRGADRELDQGQVVKQQKRQEHQTTLQIMHEQLLMQEAEADRVTRLLGQRKAENEAVEEGYRQQRRQHDDTRDRLLRKVEHDINKTRDAEVALGRINERFAAATELAQQEAAQWEQSIAGAPPEDHPVRTCAVIGPLGGADALPKAERAREEAEAEAQRLGSELANAELRLKELQERPPPAAPEEAAPGTGSNKRKKKKKK
eukprot:TRINITY_DN6801_c0_g2_i4.p1 TRINITY_DN6801_c0_g2~~TRINITY_DN6801_c0_g2_i4.p1  ORF type:complete len:1036 (+),score=284.65 TRINITY_DN6801_c0_g2_i4:77-3109(+)